MRLGEGRGLLLCAGGRRKERKIHTTLSLIGLLLRVGLWGGVSYFDLELGSRPAFSDKGRLLALMDEQFTVKPSWHEKTAERSLRGRSAH